MKESEKLAEVLKKVKNRIRALDEIEAHLLDMQDLAMNSIGDNVLDA